MELPRRKLGMLRTVELAVGRIERANCCLEGIFSNNNAVVRRQCDVWALFLHQYLSWTGRERVLTLQLAEGLSSCAATEYELRVNSVEIKISRIRTPGRDRVLGVFKTCCEG